MPDQTCKWESTLHQHKCNEPALATYRTYAEMAGMGKSRAYCILHSRNNDKDVGEFTRKVEERMSADGKIDLIDCYFPKSFNGSYFSGRTFERPVDFSGAVFAHSDFSSARFLKPAYFIGATFPQASFRGAVFSDAVYFIGTKFWQDADFGRARFENLADFIGTTFSRQADFSGAAFSGETNFKNALFSTRGNFFRTSFREVKFTGTKFEGEANFDRTNFEGDTDFYRTEFHGRTNFIRNTAKMPWRGFFRHTLFRGDITLQEVDLSRCSFLHSDIDNIDFRHCTFGSDTEYFLGMLPIHRENVLYDEKEAKDNVEFDMAGRVYRDLVKHFDAKGDRHMATDFFYGEMECRRKQMGWWGRSFSLYALSRQITGYGVRFPRSGFFILLLILVSCLFYRGVEGLPWGEAANQSLFGINVLLAHIYHVEDLSHLCMAFLCMEIIIGTFLTTSFVLIIQRVFTPFK